MIEMLITPNMIKAAEFKLNNIGSISTSELSKFGSEKDRILFGYIGERMVMDFLDLSIDIDDYQYDLMWYNHKIEVKAISCKFKPPEHFLATVNSHDLNGVHKQQADIYIFARIKNDKSIGWLVGYLPCNEFFLKGKFIPKGTQIADGVEFTKANATVLPISELCPIEYLNPKKYII